MWFITMTKEEQFEYIKNNYPATAGIHSKRLTRRRFFSKIETEIQAYLLGLYASDGNITEKRKTFRISLQQKDAYAVDWFKKFISPDARTFLNQRKIKIIRNCNITNSVYYGIDINCSDLCNDLVNLGFGYRKTYADTHLPNIPPELMRHFIRGYFDGDGTIMGCYIKPDPKWKKNENFRTKMSICCKKRSILDDIKEYLKNLGIKSTINYSRRDDMYEISSPKSQIKKLFYLLYDDAHFYLQRKYDKFEHYANTEITQLIAENRKA